MSNKLISKGFFGAASGLALMLTGCTGTPADKAEDIIAEVCDSDAPLLIIDNFRTETPDFGVMQYGTAISDIDISGDGMTDIAHGDLVAAVARLSGKDVMTYSLGIHPLYINQRTVTQALWDVFQKIESGEIPKPAAISMSIGVETSLEQLNNSLRADMVLTNENLADKKEEIISAFKGPKITSHINEYPDYEDVLDTIAVFDAFKKRGIPIITASGNDYTQKINMLSILGDISVGALTIDGQKAGYSNNSSLTTAYRTGDIVGRQLEDGIDLNNDDIPEFSNEIMSGALSNAYMFNGHAADQYDPPENDPEFVKHETPYGDYLLKRHYPYREENGRLYFDPLDNGDPRQVSITFGTSFAAPNICGK